MRHPDRTLLSQWHLAGKLNLTRGCRLKTHMDLFPVLVLGHTYTHFAILHSGYVKDMQSCGKTSPVQARQLDEQP